MEIKIFKKNYFFVFLYTLVFAAFFALVFEKYGNPLIDTGRELYTPLAISKLGCVLYKDIVCIYGPLSYVLNSILVKFFGAKIAVFYWIGGFLAYFFGLVFYFISNNFISKINSFLLTLAVLAICVFSTSSIFNYILPYSFAMSYGGLICALTLFCSLKFLKTKKHLFLYLATFLTSLGILTKLDFSALLIPLVILFIFSKPNFKTFLKSCAVFILPFLIFACYLFFNDVSFAEFLNNSKIISKMANSPSFHYFYAKFSGFAPNMQRFAQVFTKLIILIPILLLPLGLILLYKFLNPKNRAAAEVLLPFIIISLIVSTCFFLFDVTNFYFIFCYLTLFCLIAFCSKILAGLIQRRKIQFELSKENFLIIFSIFYSLKSLFFLSLDNYGVFYAPFIFLSTTVILKDYIKILPDFTPVLKKFSLYFLALAFFAFTLANVQKCLDKGLYTLNSDFGKIYLPKSDVQVFSSAFNSIKDLNPHNEPILGIPEGLFFNYVFQTVSPVFATSFTPMDFDAYGEKELAEAVLAAKPKIFFITSRDTGDYGKSHVCLDYGQDFCIAVLDNYTLRTVHKTPVSRTVIMVYERKR